MAPSNPPVPAATSRHAQVVLAVIAVGGVLYWLSGILTPLALAVFVMVMIDSFARVLVERVPRFPPGAALPAAIAFSALIFAAVAMVVAANAGAFAAELFGYAPKLNALIGRLAAHIGVAAPTLGEMVQRLNPMAMLGPVIDGVRGFATTAFLVLIYLGFLLASRQGFERKTARLFPSPEDRRNAIAVFVRIRDGVERYLWIQTVTGGVIAFGSWAVMTALGLDNAVFWGFLIFILSYVPVIGGFIGIVAPPIFALVQFDGWWRAAVMLAGLQAINFVVGNIVLPRMQGRSLNVDPVVLLLSLAFWGVMWGLPGMFLSTPLAVTAMAILAQFQGARWVAVLLSGDGEPGDPDPAPPRGPTFTGS